MFFVFKVIYLFFQFLIPNVFLCLANFQSHPSLICGAFEKANMVLVVLICKTTMLYNHLIMIYHNISSIVCYVLQ